MSFLPSDIDARLHQEIEQRGLALLEVKRRGERGTTVIEIIVDAESGVTLDALSDLSRWTSALFDEVEEAIPGRYRLEVSSAGLSRPLEHLWQYRKNIGRLLKLTFDDDTGTRRSELFRLDNLDGETLIVAPASGNRKQATVTVEIPLVRVVRAVIEPQF